ncbi:7433_t:CDS:2 [Entrophospora sp. SA101]|nr:7433_t:CDS:2 [Entrophospora sp. SA101]
MSRKFLSAIDKHLPHLLRDCSIASANRHYVFVLAFSKISMPIYPRNNDQGRLNFC